MSVSGAAGELDFMQQASLRDIAKRMADVEETIDDICQMDQSHANKKNFGEMSECSFMNFDAHTEDLRAELARADNLDELKKKAESNDSLEEMQIHVRPVLSPVSSNLSLSVDATTYTTSSTPRSERLLRVMPGKLRSSTTNGKEFDFMGGSLLNLANRMNDLEKTIDNITGGSPSFRRSMSKGCVEPERRCSTVEEDIRELQKELELADEVEPLDMQDADATDMPSSIERVDSTSGLSITSDSGLVRSNSRSDLGFLKRTSLVKLAKRMKDLDATLEEFHRNTLAHQIENKDCRPSEISLGEVQFDELRRELDMAGSIKSLSDIESSPSLSTDRRKSVDLASFALDQVQKKLDETADVKKDLEDEQRKLMTPGTQPPPVDATSVSSAVEEPHNILERQDCCESFGLNKKGVIGSNASYGSTYLGSFNATVSVTSAPSRLELLKARNKRMRARSSKKLEESRMVVQGCRSPRRMNADESSMSGGSVVSQSSSAYVSKHEQIPEHVEFKLRQQEAHPLQPLWNSQEEIKLQAEHEKLKQLLEGVKYDRDRLQKDLDATREESRRVRRLLCVLVVLVLCALFWRPEYSSAVKCFNEKAYSSAMNFLNNNGYYSAFIIFDQSDETDEPIKPVRRRFSVKPEVLPELKPIKMDEKLNRGVIRLSSNLHTFNSTIDPGSETEEGVNLKKNEKKTIQSRIKLIRGAFCRRSRRRIIRVLRGVKVFARRLLGDAEAGGMLDFKHNNVGVWAKTGTI